MKWISAKLSVKEVKFNSVDSFPVNVTHNLFFNG